MLGKATKCRGEEGGATTLLTLKAARIKENISSPKWAREMIQNLQRLWRETSQYKVKHTWSECLENQQNVGGGGGSGVHILRFANSAPYVEWTLEKPSLTGRLRRLLRGYSLVSLANSGRRTNHALSLTCILRGKKNAQKTVTMIFFLHTCIYINHSHR